MTIVFLPATQNHLLGLGQTPASEKKGEGEREGKGGFLCRSYVPQNLKLRKYLGNGMFPFSEQAEVERMWGLCLGIGALLWCFFQRRSAFPHYCMSHITNRPVWVVARFLFVTEKKAHQ